MKVNANSGCVLREGGWSGESPCPKWERLPQSSKLPGPLSVLGRGLTGRGLTREVSFLWGLSVSQLSLLFNFTIWRNGCSGCAPFPGAQIAFVQSQRVNYLMQEPGRQGRSRRWRRPGPAPQPQPSERQLSLLSPRGHFCLSGGYPFAFLALRLDFHGPALSGRTFCADENTA